MMVAGRFGLLVLAFSSVMLAGCPLRPEPGDNGSEPGTLSPQVQQAVDDVVARTQATFQALTSFVDGVSIDLEVGQDAIGQCPVVEADRQDGVVSIVLDYGDGCSNEAYDDSTVSGRILLSLAVLDEQSLSVVYEDFAVDDQTVVGGFSLELDREDFARRLTGDINITTSDLGSTDGTLDVEVRVATVTITVTTANLTLSDESDSFDVAIEGIVIKPKREDNGNFVPEAGTISFEIADDDDPSELLAIVIAFDAESPVDGTVQIKVGSLPPLEYKLPGF
ncbi:MAG: hypothetical protein IIC01_02785 [Planctomycetes bacterium]|nr:hypothetical protein [Planctomycetota bacterium]